MGVVVRKKETKMIGWIVIGAAVTIMVKAAEMEDRSTILWGGITLALCIACSIFIPLPLINIVIGLALTYLAMLIANLLRKD
jgi:hypothetical protein